MQYLVSKKVALKTILLPIIVFIFSLSMFWILKIDNKIDSYFLIYVLMSIAIYTFFIQNFKRYNLSSVLFITLWAFCMQTFSVYGIMHGVYSYESFYYFLLFFIIFYLLLLFDIKKANDVATNRNIYLTKLIHKVKIEKNGDYYIDDEQTTFNAKHNIPNGEINLTSFYTFIIVTVIGLPIILFGKFAVAIGLLSGRYFPDSNFIFFFAMFILGTLFFIMGITGFLTYLKLDLSEDEAK